MNPAQSGKVVSAGCSLDNRCQKKKKKKKDPPVVTHNNRTETPGRLSAEGCQQYADLPQ